MANRGCGRAATLEEVPVSMLGREVGVDEVGRLDTIPVDPELTRVHFTGHELQSLCPAVEYIQPDIYEWSISFQPNGVSIESKSLKLYLTTFRDERVFAEELAVRIARAVRLCVGATAHVSLRQNIRGGIIETVEAVAAFEPPAG
jgi:7-cyano-7-deazaguanine reductase